MISEVELPNNPSGDWRAHLTLFAQQTRAAILHHPWLASLFGTRPGLGPHWLKCLEFFLATVDGLGLTMIDMQGFSDIRNLGLMEPPRSRMALEAKFVREVPRGMPHQRRRHFPILWPGSVCECDPRTTRHTTGVFSVQSMPDQAGKRCLFAGCKACASVARTRLLWYRNNWLKRGRPTPGYILCAFIALRIYICAIMSLAFHQVRCDSARDVRPVCASDKKQE
jgi:tetracycline repressor-like protein